MKIREVVVEVQSKDVMELDDDWDRQVLAGRAIRGITLELWEDDGSREFNRTHDRAARQLAVDPTVEHLIR